MSQNPAITSAYISFDHVSAVTIFTYITAIDTLQTTAIARHKFQLDDMLTWSCLSRKDVPCLMCGGGRKDILIENYPVT